MLLLFFTVSEALEIFKIQKCGTEEWISLKDAGMPFISMIDEGRTFTWVPDEEKKWEDKRRKFVMSSNEKKNEWEEYKKKKEEKHRIPTEGVWKVFLGKKLGDGGFGDVYEAYLQLENKFLCFGAVKTMIKGSEEVKVIEAMENEKNMAKKLSGVPNVAQIIGASPNESQTREFIIYKRYGRSLDNELDTVYRKNKNAEEEGLEKTKDKYCIPFRFIISFVVKSIKLLKDVHTTQGIAFRDLKPDNVLLSEKQLFVFIDFGSLNRY
jgi:hypothetical protein